MDLGTVPFYGSGCEPGPRGPDLYRKYTLNLADRDSRTNYFDGFHAEKRECLFAHSFRCCGPLKG